jgi:CYTH domain-containing protein
MALEIERRFLVHNRAWQSLVKWEAVIQQGYLLSQEDGLTTRVRLQKQEYGSWQAWLTIKARSYAGGPAYARLEFEYPIPVEDAKELLLLSPWRLSKKRYGLRLSDGDWVLDVFDGPNSPLVIAEVELEDSEVRISIPKWCGQEVTGRHQFSNAALARTPFQAWNQKDREEVESPLNQSSEDINS